MAGAALAQITVSASFAGVSSSVRELPRPVIVGLAWLLPLAAVVTMVFALGDAENNPLDGSARWACCW